MPRKATWPPKITEHRGSGQGRVHFKGVDYWLGPFGNPQMQERYAALLVKLAGGDAEASAPASPRPDYLTVADVAERFLEHAERSKSPGQFEKYRVALLPLLRLYAGLDAADLDADRLETVRDAMIDGSWMNGDERAWRLSRHKPLTWCRATANQRVGLIGAIWKWAEKKKHVPKGSYAGLRTLDPLRRNAPGVRESARRQSTRRADLDRVLPFVQQRMRLRPCAAMLELQFLTGCRSGEVCVMRPAEIDREGGPVIDGKPVWLYRPHKYKTEDTGVPRVVALGPAAQAILAPWLLRCPEPTAYLFRPRKQAGRNWPGRYTTQVYDLIVQRACKKAGVKILAYGGRHSFKDRAAKAFNLDAARAAMGHATVEMTSAYGEQMDLEKAAEVAAKLG